MEEILPGTLYIVSTPIGNLEDISFRAIRVLKSVDFIAAEDTRTTAVLLQKYDISKKMIAYYSRNQNRQTLQIIRRLKDGESCALVSDAGTPGISDPAHMLVKASVQENIRIVPVPGATAMLATLVVSGLPTNRFVFEGFLPTKKGRKTRIHELQTEVRTLIFYESKHRIKKTVNELLEAWGDRDCVMGREITKKFEEFFRGTLSQLSDRLEKAEPRGEIVLIVQGATPAKVKSRRNKEHE